MSSGSDGAESIILSGDAILGIEFGSTRIKASLIAKDTTPLATGSHSWENQLVGGVWTYDMADVFKGLAACYAALLKDIKERYSVELTRVAALGVSGMMHGYVALDRDGRLLAPFRTWRNNLTGDACAALSPLLDFAVPQRWSIAHLYQAILESRPHVPEIAHLTTLAGYVHFSLTGQHNMGVGEASGMFPIDPATCNWDGERLDKLQRLIASHAFSWKLSDILPQVLPAGCEAGRLTAEGAKLLDPTGRLQPGIPLCPPEGDAGTGMVATNAVRPRCGNVSAGTSVFAMIVLEKNLSQVRKEIDIVATPDGRPVAMAHANNGSSDLDAWLGLFGQVAEAMGAEVSFDKLYEKLPPLALEGDPDGGGLLSINYVSGEHVTGFTQGRPLFVRSPTGSFTLQNFMRATYYASLCAMRTGMDILTDKEKVVIEEIRGHGGFFKGGETGQRMMAAALGVPVSVPKMAGEGGAWGMAILASYMLRSDDKLLLPDYLDAHIASSIGAPIKPDPEDMRGFALFYERHKRGLAIERAAVNALP